MTIAEIKIDDTLFILDGSDSDLHKAPEVKTKKGGHQDIVTKTSVQQVREYTPVHHGIRATHVRNAESNEKQDYVQLEQEVFHDQQIFRKRPVVDFLPVEGTETNPGQIRTFILTEQPEMDDPHWASPPTHTVVIFHEPGIPTQKRLHPLYPDRHEIE